MKKVVTLGEIMLRLTTPGFDKIEQARNFAATYGGGEANVAISLAQLGLDSFICYKITKESSWSYSESVFNRAWSGYRTYYLWRRTIRDLFL